MYEKSKLLKKAIASLKGKEVINSDSDVAKDTGYDKSTISSYKNGNQEPSEAFIAEFEKVYKLSLKSFKDYSDSEVPNNLKEEIQNTGNREQDLMNMISQLMKQQSSLLNSHENTSLAVRDLAESHNTLTNSHAVLTELLKSHYVQNNSDQYTAEVLAAKLGKIEEVIVDFFANPTKRKREDVIAALGIKKPGSAVINKSTDRHVR